MIEVIRDAGTDYLFAGLLAKELESRPFPIDLKLFIEPRVKGPYYFTQDGRIEKPDQKGNIEFCFYTQPSQREEMCEVFGKNCALVTYAADPLIHYQHLEIPKTYDVGFIGKPGGDDRNMYLDALSHSGLKFFNSETIDGGAIAYELSKCKVLFNHVRYVDVNLRFFEEMAIGCQLVNYNKYLKLFGIEGVHYLTCNDPKDMVRMLKELLNDHPRVIEYISINARSHFLSNHTYAHRATAIINHLKEYLCLSP